MHADPAQTKPHRREPMQGEFWPRFIDDCERKLLRLRRTTCTIAYALYLVDFAGDDGEFLTGYCTMV